MRILTIAAILILLVLTTLSGQQATIQEEKQVIKTYPFSGADPAPIMTRSSMWGKGPRLYPYSFFDTLSYEGKDQAWKVIKLENPYIKVMVLPEEGGKVLGAIEKSTGKEFIYYNKVRKFRHIALRGPWTSGGIELNFGIVGHSPATATPVDYVTRKNTDGSVSVTVGAMDLPSRTHWRVTFTVPSDKAYFESKALWYNPQPLNGSYYVWMNAANRLGQDLEFIFPGDKHIGHNYRVPEKPWPVTADGRNLAFYKDHDDSDEGSFFIHGALQDFFGSYWHNSKFGFGHWAYHEDTPGQKFFRWSLSGAGQIWEQLLTDSDGPYFEPQVGRLLDQNDHEFFPPYTADHWREVWFPFKEIGPMVKATPYGALNARNTGDSIVLGFNALQNIDDDLVVRAGGKEVYRERLKLEPMGVYQKKLALTAKPGELEVEIGNKLSYTDDPEAEKLKRPLNFHEYDDNSLEALYQGGEREEKGRNYEVALDKYMAVLKQEPTHVRALTRVAELYTRRAEYKKALEYATKALDYVMYDPDANYIYGVIARKMGNMVDAKETLGWAARSMKYRSGAYCQLGEIYMMEGKWARAFDFLRRSLDYDAYNVKTYQVLSTAYRLHKEPAKARETLDKLLEIDPLNHLARFEQYLLEPNGTSLENFRSMIRNELPHETYLETAMHYVNLGLPEDAQRVLAAGPEQPQILYWRAYLSREKDPARSRELLQKASGSSPKLVFPFREESIPVFQWAEGMAPNDWKAKYYLGLIYWGLRRHQDAIAALDECGNRPDFGTFYVCRAFLRKETDPEKALPDYERAYETGKDDWRNWHHLAAFYNERGMNDKALQIAQAGAKQFPDADLMKIMLARTYLSNGRSAECYSVLENATILPFEGQRDVHDLFVQCQTSMALELMKKGQYREAIQRLESAKEYPVRLGTGKPHRADQRIQDFLMMLSYEKLGDQTNARQAMERVVAYMAGPSSDNADVLKRRVDLWFKDSFPNQNGLAALQDLLKMVGSGRRRGGD
ncbi:MAG TPA: DUF5107 domain-containing protein [Bryobacteraceae bacterium]|nr:DUF5107 domain-containing protein [Bryobacteraceae bacterium]